MKMSSPLVIAILALAVAASAWIRPSQPAPTEVTSLNSLQSAGKPITRTAAPHPEAAPVTIISDNSDLTAALLDLQNRFDRIERQLTEMKGGWDGLARRGMVPLTDEYETALRGQVMDPNLPWKERVDAFRLLRRHNSVTDDVALSLVQIAQTDGDERARIEAIRNLDGITNSVIMPSLMSTIASTTDANMRRHAVDALSAFSGDPSVDQKLRELAMNDESPEVRREARQALHEKFGRMDQDELAKAVSDRSLSSDEQVAALRRLGNDNKSSEVVTSMMNLYMNSDDSQLRADILRGMDGVKDPTVRDPLLNFLAKDPDPQSRGEAAENLRHFREDPDVKAWLEWAATNDTDDSVRAAAAAALEGREPRGRDRGRGGDRGGDRGGRGRGR